MACVYIRRSGNENLFKIGRTANDDVEDRIRKLSTGNPHRLTEIDIIETEDELEWEQYLHKMLRSKRSCESAAQEFFEVAPEVLKSVIREAREFLPEFLATRRAAERLADEKSEDRIATPGDEQQAIYKELLEIREQEDKCAYKRKHLENKLKLAIGTAAGLEGIATWKTRAVSRLDQAAFREAQPELYRTYSKTSYERRFDLRIGGAQPDREGDARD